MAQSGSSFCAPYHKGKNVEELYALGEVLGRGAFSVVKKGVHKQNGKPYAVKIIQKKMVRLEVLDREISIMQRMHHPHVLSLQEVFEDANIVAIVLDLVTGGELFEKVIERGHFSEKDASVLVKQTLEAVAYLHSEGVAHRDLKPENLLCRKENDQLHILVSDFGLSRLLNEGEFSQMSTQCGSLEYCAPEVLSGTKYEKSVDLWSVGVITYILLTGFFPFYDPNRDPAAMYEKIQNVEYDWEDCPEVSAEAKDFVAKLLVYDAKDRMTAEEALKHPWMRGETLSSENLHGTFGNLLKMVKKKKT